MYGKNITKKNTQYTKAINFNKVFSKFKLIDVKK